MPQSSTNAAGRFPKTNTGTISRGDFYRPLLLVTERFGALFGHSHRIPRKCAHQLPLSQRATQRYFPRRFSHIAAFVYNDAHNALLQHGAYELNRAVQVNDTASKDATINNKNVQPRTKAIKVNDAALDSDIS
jgi:hypothetical protein